MRAVHLARSHQLCLTQMPVFIFTGQAVGHNDIAEGIISEYIICGVKIRSAPEGSQAAVGKFELESDSRNGINILSVGAGIRGTRRSGWLSGGSRSLS